MIIEPLVGAPCEEERACILPSRAAQAHEIGEGIAILAKLDVRFSAPTQ